MKLLILIGHGSYDSNFRLNSYGKLQMHEIARKIKLFIEGKTVLMMSSTAPRALDSTQILAEKLKQPFEQHEALLSDNEHPINNEHLLALIKSRESHVDVLILVTHLKYIYEFPRFFGKVQFNIAFPWFEVLMGTAVIINCEERSVRQLY